MSLRWAVLAAIGALWLCGAAMAAEEEPNEALVEMIAGLLGDSDRDMRAIGLQQVREEVPGAAATRRFVALLPTLSPEARAALVEALGERGDAAARPAVIAAVKSAEGPVRVAAIVALGKLGGEADVPVLLEKLAGPEAEAAAARESLVRLNGKGVNALLVAALGRGKAAPRAALLDVLAQRNATEAVDEALGCASDEDPALRAAALVALRTLAGEEQVPALVKILKQSTDGAGRSKAEATLLAVCGRGGTKCLADVVAGMQGADVPSRMALLHAVGRIGGPEGLKVIVAALNDETGDKEVRDEALRILSSWTDRTAAPHLVALAKGSDSLRYHVLAIRGLVRLAGPQPGRAADVGLLVQTMGLARRPEEKQGVLAALGSLGTADALAAIEKVLDDEALVEPAALAAVTCVEKGTAIDKAARRTALEKVLAKAQGEAVRERAKEALGSL